MHDVPSLASSSFPSCPCLPHVPLVTPSHAPIHPFRFLPLPGNRVSLHVSVIHVLIGRGVSEWIRNHQRTIVSHYTTRSDRSVWPLVV